MSIDELVELYILQKDSIVNPMDSAMTSRLALKIEEHLLNIPMSREYEIAPKKNENDDNKDSTTISSADIPFVLYKPETASKNCPAPLIVYTHAGPSVYHNKEKNNPVILYFLSKGYVVVVPNYRGSTDHPSTDETVRKSWLEYVNQKEFFHDLIPRDVYQVTEYMSKKDYIDSTNIFLHGMSYAAFINAQLLTQINIGKFKNLFKAAHLDSGINYPSPLELPSDIPLLMVHGRKDDVAAPEQAQLFFEGALLNQLALQRNNGDHKCNIQTFFSDSGNHYMISTRLTHTSSKDTNEYKELEKYLTLITSFFIDNTNNNFHYTNPFTQLCELNNHYKNREQVEKIVENLSNLLTHRRIYEEKLFSSFANPYHIDWSTHQIPRVRNTNKFLGPTMAMLRLYLNDDYTGNIRNDLTTYLSLYFKPYERRQQTILSDAGQAIIDKNDLLNQLVEMVKNEETFLVHHPGHVVFYHAGDNSVLQLYTFITLWKKLFNKIEKDTSNMHDIRLFEYMKRSFNSIDSFLANMNQQRDNGYTGMPFNYLPGFAERTIACNPSLISNSHTTSSSSLFWYCNQINNNAVNLNNIIPTFLKTLGIYSEHRARRYQTLFEQCNNDLKLSSSENALMQQFFVPDHEAEKYAYLCQIYGEPFKKNDMNLQHPSSIKKFIENPMEFELNFNRDENARAVVNYEKCPNFGDKSSHFLYSGLLQVRYLYNPENVSTFSYFRNEKMQKTFAARLSKIIIEDFTAHLASESPITPSLSNFNLSDYQLMFKKKYNHEILFLQQKELLNELVETPSYEEYSKILYASKTEKKDIQSSIWVYENKKPNKIYTFSLCEYLVGYTYYDLIFEAIEKHPTINKEEHDALLKVIAHLSDPETDLSSQVNIEQYQSIEKLLSKAIDALKFDPLMHTFKSTFQSIGTDSGCEELFKNEKKQAIICLTKRERCVFENTNFDPLQY